MKRMNWWVVLQMECSQVWKHWPLWFRSCLAAERYVNADRCESVQDMVMVNEYCIERGHISNCKSNCQRNREHRKEERKQNFSCFCDYGHIQTPMEKMVVGAICVCLIIKSSFARHFLFSCSFHFFTLFFSLFLPVSLSVSVDPVQEKRKNKRATPKRVSLFVVGFLQL